MKNETQPQFKVISLGDYLGASGRYFGACCCCRKQFHSTTDRVARANIGRICEACAGKAVTDGLHFYGKRVEPV